MAPTPNTPTQPQEDPQPTDLVRPVTTLYILDCGCFTDNELFFGLIGGNEIFLLGLVPSELRSEKRLGSWNVAGKHVGSGVRGPLWPDADEPELDLIEDRQLRGFFDKFYDPSQKHLVVKVKTFHGEYSFDMYQFDYANTKEVPGDVGMVTSAGRAVLFIPDTHIGTRDKADNFARRPGLQKQFRDAHYSHGGVADSNLNFRLLEKLVGAAQDAGIKLVQTGDLLDIWEVEAKENIYCAWEGEREQKDLLLHSDDWDWTRRRSIRAYDATGAIFEAWNDYGAIGSEFETLFKKFDYLLGNHDAEYHPEYNQRYDRTKKWGLSQSQQSADPSFLQDPRKRHWFFPAKVSLQSLRSQDGGALHAESRWIAEHGHAYDQFNTTLGYKEASALGAKGVVKELIKKRAVQNIGEMMYVPGKQITYCYVNAERGEKSTDGKEGIKNVLLEGLKIMTTGLLPVAVMPDGDPVFPDLNPNLSSVLEPPGMDLLKQLQSNVGYAEEDDPSLFVWIARLGVNVTTENLYSDVHQMMKESNIYPVTFNNAGTFERMAFLDGRKRMLNIIRKKLISMNGGKFSKIQYSMLAGTEKDGGIKEYMNHLTVNYYPKDTKKPIELPFRVLIHGHTHQPVLVRLNIYSAPVSLGIFQEIGEALDGADKNDL